MVIDVEIFQPDEVGDGKPAQARYLVHGTDDVLWTDSIDSAVEYIRECLEREAADVRHV